MLEVVTLGYFVVWETSSSFPNNFSTIAAYLLIYHPGTGSGFVMGIFPV
jgi:hypothetical protein